MIIDKIKDLYTDEEIKKESDLRSRLAKAKNRDELKAIMDELYTLEDEVKFRYATSCIDNKEKIFNDAEEVLNALKREDFHKRNASIKRSFKKRKLSKDASNVVDNAFEDTQDHALFYILYQIRDFITICDMVSPEDSETLKAMAEEKASSWFKGEGLEVFKPSYPDIYKRSTTKLEREIFSSNKTYEELKNIEVNVARSDKKNKKTVPYIVNASFEAPKALFPETVTPFDIVVLNAVVSLTRYGCKVFTAKQVAKFILYGQGKSNPSERQVERVREIIETLSVTKVSIDWTEQSRQYRLKDGIKHLRKAYILPICEEIFITPNNKEISGYKLIDDTPFFIYSDTFNQIADIPSEALNVGVNLTDEKIIIRDYFFERIEGMKSNPKLSRVVLFDSILERANLSNISRKKKSGIIKAVRSMLKHWKNIKYIDDYSENLKGQKIVGYTLKVSKAKSALKDSET